MSDGRIDHPCLQTLPGPGRKGKGLACTDDSALRELEFLENVYGMNGFATIRALERVPTFGKRNRAATAWALNSIKYDSPTPGRLNNRSKVDYDVS